MDDFDDRPPLGVYHNLHTIHTTSTPKAVISNEKTNGDSPYVDISFKFGEMNRNQKHQLLPNGNSQVPSNNTSAPSYCQNVVASSSPLPVSLASAAGVSPRPVSQHSQLSDSSTVNQSIAAVKAALSDAKSKFFGLNGYASSNDNNNRFESPDNLLPENNSNKSKVQIAPKAQPTYQNIPHNSAIYRNAFVREPSPSPQPAKRQKSNSPEVVSCHSHLEPSSPPQSSSSFTPESSILSPQSQGKMPSSSSTSAAGPSASASHPTGSTYKQILLNDLDYGISNANPSQAVYMTTTVPQNIKGSKIAGRHTPTRNSLRHSRMLVVNKNYQGIQYPNPLNFKHPNLARILLILEVIFGLFISFIGVWIVFLAPNTRIQDNPYWSGLALLIAGILGLVLIRYHRIKRNKLRENCFIFLRADSYFLSMVAVFLCLVAFVCAAIHFARLSASDTKCSSSDILLAHASCLCTFNSVEATNSTELLEESTIADESYSFQYRDLSCNEVSGEWMNILVCSVVFNFLGFLVALAYIVLLACFRHNSKRFYASVHTSAI